MHGPHAAPCTGALKCTPIDMKREESLQWNPEPAPRRCMNLPATGLYARFLKKLPFIIPVSRAGSLLPKNPVGLNTSISISATDTIISLMP